MSDQYENEALRDVAITGMATCSDEEIATIIEEWDRVQITDTETGEVIHDSL